MRSGGSWRRWVTGCSTESSNLGPQRVFRGRPSKHSKKESSHRRPAMYRPSESARMDGDPLRGLSHCALRLPYYDFIACRSPKFSACARRHHASERRLAVLCQCLAIHHAFAHPVHLHSPPRFCLFLPVHRPSHSSSPTPTLSPTLLFTSNNSSNYPRTHTANYHNHGQWHQRHRRWNGQDVPRGHHRHAARR